MADKLADELLRRYSELKAERDMVWMTNWQQISQYFLPQQSDIQVKKTENVANWTDEIFDTTPIEAAETLKTGQFNWLTPPQQPWVSFKAPAELQLEDGDEGVQWLGRCSEIALRRMAESNFYSIASMSYLGVAVFATDFMLVEEGKKTRLNFRHAKIGTYVIEEDSEGIVDTTMREYELTYRQAVQEFGEDALPDKMKKAAGTKGADGLKRKFKFLHCIFPREDSERLPARKDGANKAIASVNIAVDYAECVKVSGYDEQPALVQRFDKWGTNAPWGYGPAYLTLPIARQLNYVQQYLDALAELHAYPRVLIPESLEGDVDLRAGGTTTFNTSEGEAGTPREWATVGEYKLGLEMQEQRREQLRDAFFNKAFKLLNSEPLLDKKMTAFEIAQRQAEQLGDFTPSLGRRVTEFLTPLMLRVFGILYRAGDFGQAPASLMRGLGGGKTGLVMPQVSISNRLTDSLKALKNRATEETFQFMLPQVQLGKPEVMDIFDLDKVNSNYALNAGMSPDELRPVKGKNSIDAVRGARSKMMEEQRTAQLAEQASVAGKNLGASPEWMQEQAKSAMAKSA